MGNSKEIRNVAIVGTGVIGASWAALYLARGLNVVATDPAPNAEANLRKYVDAAWKDLTVIGLSPNASRDHLKFTTDMKQALADADLVQENGPERKDFKIKLFADMDAATRPDAIIASSSSGLTMSVMQSGCKHPERCVIGHPFNPPHVVPLVEVVAGEKTSAETVQRAISFYESVGKKPIHVRKEVVGHVANRLQAALYREVVYLIEQFTRQLTTWWKDLGSITDFSPTVKQTIIEGVTNEANGRSIQELERERDSMLLELLATRAKGEEVAQAAIAGGHGD